MAEGAIQAYDVVLNAARKLPPAEQLRLAKELISGDHWMTFWEAWQHQLIEGGEVASDAEIDVIVEQVRAERHRGDRR